MVDPHQKFRNTSNDSRKGANNNWMNKVDDDEPLFTLKGFQASEHVMSMWDTCEGFNEVPNDPKRGPVRQFVYPPGEGKFQWRGWDQDDYPMNGVQYFRMSFFVRWDSTVPPVSENFGVKIQGHVYNDWVKTCKKGQWSWVSVVGEQTMEDLGRFLIIFDTV